MTADDVTDVITLDELKRRYILRVLALVGGNKSRATDLLEVERRTLYRRIERYEGRRILGQKCTRSPKAPQSSRWKRGPGD